MTEHIGPLNRTVFGHTPEYADEGRQAMSKHTPGPLKAARTFHNNAPDTFGIYTTERPHGQFNGVKIATCIIEDDARLYAAAPDMLAALVTAYGHLSLGHGGDAALVIRAAIDKAEGR